MNYWLLNGDRVPVGKTAKTVKVINDAMRYCKKKAKPNVQKGSDDAQP